MKKVNKFVNAINPDFVGRIEVYINDLETQYKNLDLNYE
jgi:heme oxygenase